MRVNFFSLSYAYVFHNYLQWHTGRKKSGHFLARISLEPSLDNNIAIAYTREVIIYPAANKAFYNNIGT